MTQMIISQDSLLGDNDLPAGSGKIIWMCIYHMCCCVLALIYVWIYLCLYIYLLYNAKLYFIFQNLLISLVSLHTLTAWKGQILWRKANQLPVFLFVCFVFLRNSPFLIYRKMFLSTKINFPQTLFLLHLHSALFLSSSSVFGYVKSSSFLMDFLLTDFLFTIRGCS